MEVITVMFYQQKCHFDNNDLRASVKDWMVSISKPYMRPIVRGKEVKSVEFGAKCNNNLVDGLSFIEKLSYNAFNDGARLPHCLNLHWRLFGVEVKKVGEDASYAGTTNRELCRKKEDDIIWKELSRVRATRMEGPFGTQKAYYGLKRIKARTK